MSSTHPSIEYERYNFHEFIHKLTIYYNNFHLDLFEKSNEYFLYFTIFISIITIIITLLTVYESNILFYFMLYIQHLFLKIKNSFFRPSSFSLTWLLNSSNHIQKRFFHEFLYVVNQKLSHQRVTADLYLITIYNLCFFMYMLLFFLGRTQYRIIAIC
jgi:hypothetical protein